MVLKILQGFLDTPMKHSESCVKVLWYCRSEFSPQIVRTTTTILCRNYRFLSQILDILLSGKLV